MTKKQILSTALAGIIAINTLAGCTSKTNASIGSNTSSSVSKTVEEDNYRITIITASIFVDKATGEKNYRVPEGFVLSGTLGYRVEKLYNSGYTYSASIHTNEDGTIEYFAPIGGRLEGSIVIVDPEYTLVTGDEAEEVLANYLEKNNTLKLTK